MKRRDTAMNNDETPIFEFEIPIGYKWLIDHGLIGFSANTSLQPWHYLPSRHVFDLNERWPSGPSNTRLVAFAKRQDSDDLACFDVVERKAGCVVLVHGWTSEGYQVERRYQTFWDWLKSVVDDIGKWAEQA
jgi:hypothetical protein